MEVHDIHKMIGGWFVGDFEPVVERSSECEVAVKYYKAGDCEECHMHKVATEITMVVSGRVLMNDQEYSVGQIIKLAPGDATDFKAFEDSVTVVVKLPSVKGDKYLI